MIRPDGGGGLLPHSDALGAGVSGEGADRPMAAAGEVIDEDPELARFRPGRFRGLTA